MKGESFPPEKYTYMNLNDSYQSPQDWLLKSKESDVDTEVLELYLESTVCGSPSLN